MASSDLVALWEAHCRYEFETRDVDATMATMVAEPYVNHIPTMTGGVGHDQLKRFYKYHFIGVNPPDFRLTPVSRTVGTDSIVDEFIVHFTHTTEIDWLLPGVPPTGRVAEVPTVGSSSSKAISWSMNISTGIRLRFSFRSDCSIPPVYRLPGLRPPTRLWTRVCRAMN
jgi:hypothetical protein